MFSSNGIKNINYILRDWFYLGYSKIRYTKDKYLDNTRKLFVAWYSKNIFFCVFLAILKRMTLWIRMNMHTIIQNNRKFLSTCILDFVNILFAQNHHLFVPFNMFFLFCSRPLLSLKNKKDINKVDIVVLVLKEFKPFIGVWRIPF